MDPSDYALCSRASRSEFSERSMVIALVQVLHRKEKCNFVAADFTDYI